MTSENTQTRGCLAIVVVLGLMAVMLLGGCIRSMRSAADLSGFDQVGMEMEMPMVDLAGAPRAVAIVVVQGQHASHPHHAKAISVVRPTQVWRADLERRGALKSMTRAFWLKRAHAASDAKQVLEVAAEEGADALLAITFDASAKGGGGPLALLTLGLFPDATASGTLTGQAVLMNVRTGRLVDRWESSDTGWQPANLWTALSASDQVRERMERRAVHDAIGWLERRIASQSGVTVPAQSDGWVGSDAGDSRIGD